MASDKSSAVAIVGIAAELPSGISSTSNLDYKSFYQFLLRRGEAYERIPFERFNVECLHGHGLGKIVTDTGAFLEGIDLFDPVEFGITSKDARAMALGTRKLIETTFLALLDSGINYRGQNVGCYMASVAHDIVTLSENEETEARGSFAGAPSMVANRVSYHLDLRGPSLPIDTACSSSLYATHLAVQALRNGDCDAAVVGGCQLNHRFVDWLVYTQGGILSPDGKCKPFDALADGFGRGEGVVVVVLKPLEPALRDKDKIYATILGTGVNSSGALAPVSAPVAIAQQDAMVRAFKQAKRRPRDVDFVELHATGTAQGDPTEANWVGSQFKRNEELLVGSVKGNIGHLEIAAFLASLCKVCAMIENGVILPTVNMTTPNSAILWKECTMRVPTSPEKLPIRSVTGRPLISMSSSGIGGANGHCVIEGPPLHSRASPAFWLGGRNTSLSLLIAGGLTPRSCTAIVDALKALPERGDHQSLGRILGRRARSMVWKAFSVAPQGNVLQFTEPVLSPRTTPSVVFVFSGQGPQYWDMGRQLFQTCIPFRETVLRLDAEYSRLTCQSLIKDVGLFDNRGVPDNLGDIWPISVTLPALTILQIALVNTLAAINIHPDVVMGHSAGETAMVYASRAASDLMVLQLALARGQAMSILETSHGAMGAVSCSAPQAQNIISRVVNELGDGTLEIGCYNSPGAVTLSGSATHVDRAVAIATSDGIFASRLRTHIPVHSSMMDVCYAEFQRLVAGVFEGHAMGNPAVETFSTLTGGLFTNAFDAQYFWDSTRSPVLFSAATASLLDRHPQAIFVEIGPRPVLLSYISAIAGKGCTYISPLQRLKTLDFSEIRSLLEFVGHLVCAGYTGTDMGSLYGTAETNADNVPSYPLSRRKVPFLAETFGTARQRQARHGPINYPQLCMNIHTHPSFAEHIIKGEPIMPAAGFIEMALEFGAKRLWNVQFLSMLSLSSERPIPVDVRRSGSEWSVHSATVADFTDSWPPAYSRLHATGYLSESNELHSVPQPLDLSAIRYRLKEMDITGFYSAFSAFANYGPTYQRIISCHRGLDSAGREEFLIKLRGWDTDLDVLPRYILHPAILDAALHIGVHPIVTGITGDGMYYLPSRLATLIIHDALLKKDRPSTIVAHVIFVSWTPDTLTYDFTMVDEDGSQLCVIKDFEVTAHRHVETTVRRRYELVQRQLDLHVDRPSQVSPLGCCGRANTVGDTNPPQECYIEGTLHILRYGRGKEMDLKTPMCQLDPFTTSTLCFFASDGVDGDSCLGFTRSLRREYPSWRIFCIIFPVDWQISHSVTVARYLCAHTDSEQEMHVAEDGSVLAPRLILSHSPARQVTFECSQPWVYREPALVQVRLPVIPPDHVQVDVSGLFLLGSSCRAFVGRIAGSSGVWIGIMSGPLSNFVITHRGAVAELKDYKDILSVPHVLAMVIAVLGVGIRNFPHPSRFEQSPILVTYADSNLGRAITQFYQGSGWNTISLYSNASKMQIWDALAEGPRFIVSGKDDATSDHLNPTLQHMQPKKLFAWDDTTNGIVHTMSEDPWAIGDAIVLALRAAVQPVVSFSSPTDLLSPGLPQRVLLDCPLFDADKAYLLLGGIGALGAQIAWWMYKNGARKLLLASRSGEAGLVAKDEFISLRIFSYLRSQPGLDIRLDAVDVASADQMKDYLCSVRSPIGGCMILTAVLSDRTFAMQTPEGFEAPFTSKVAVFNALQNAIDLDALDFVLAFSSVAGLFGNAGQTSYSSANSALAGLTRQRRNAATIVPPIITNTGRYLSLSTTNTTLIGRYKHLTPWGMTSEELCECIGDALLKLSEGPLWQYIPDFDWSLVQANLGSSPLYDHLVSTSPAAAMSPQRAGPTALRTLQSIVSEALGIDQKDLSPQVPLTSCGLDSLSAAALSRALKPVLDISQLQLLADVTLGDLERLRSQREAEETKPGAFDDQSIRQKSLEMSRILGKYTSLLPSATERTVTNSTNTLLLTGGTGSLGSHLLARLLASSHCDRIYVFVRSSRADPGDEPRDRLVKSFRARGLDTSLLGAEGLSVVTGDLSQDALGLPPSTYMEVLYSVTHIVHLAWPIDFTAPLSAFENAILSLRNLVELAAQSSAQVRFVFASTDSIFRRLPDADFARERLIDDPLVAAGTGYTESKWVAEHLLSEAGARGLLAPTIVRVGQLSGGINGAWKVTEWFPALVSASIALGCLPDGSGSVQWLPADVAAAAVSDFMECTELVVHLRHPSPVSWTEVLRDLSFDMRLPLVPYPEWFMLLEDALGSTHGATAMEYLKPGLRLLDIFRLPFDPNVPRPDIMSALVCPIDLTRGLATSPTLRDAHQHRLSNRDVRSWLEYWRGERFIPAAPANNVQM